MRGFEAGRAHSRNKPRPMSRNFLSEILAQKRQAVARIKARPSFDRLRKRALEIRKTAVQHRLLQALKSESPKLKIIAEFKRRSPSAGRIRDDRSAEEVARSYERGGACRSEERRVGK